jgi:hypothetical protein
VTVPESRARKKADYTPPPTRAAGPTTSPSWFAPVMVALLVLGLIYVVVFYVTDGRFPVQSLGAWNVVVGFAVMMAGFVMATRWR